MSTTLTEPGPAPTLHAFQTRPSPARSWEKRIFWLFRLATYGILLCGIFVFGTIFVRGFGSVFQASPPFINVAFFTEAPESLHVFEFEGKKMELGDRAFREFQTTHTLGNSRVEHYVYSAGGILPNIVGTVFLVVGA